MRLRFACILQQHLQRKILKREWLMKLIEGMAQAKIDRSSKILEKHLGSTNNICTIVDTVYAMGQTIEERKGLKPSETRKEKKNNEGLTRRI